MIRHALAAIGAAVCAVAFSSGAEAAAPQKGSCIFSTKVMPKDNFKDPAYKAVKDVFSPDDPIAVRCFYENGPQSAYAKLGRVANSMRDSGKYYAELQWDRPKEAGGSFSLFRIKAVNHNYNSDWTTQRYDLTSDFAQCDFRLSGDARRQYGARSNGCMNFPEFIRLQSKREGISPPTRPKFCVRIFMKFANTEVYRELGGTVRKEPDYLEKTMASGCFSMDLAGVSMEGASAAGVEVSHKEALDLLERSCQGMYSPPMASKVCPCFRTEAVAQGIGEYTPNAASLWAMMLNRGAYSEAEFRALYDRATKSDRTAAASGDIQQFGQKIFMKCIQAAR